MADFINIGESAAGLVVGLAVGIAADPIRQWFLRARLLPSFQTDDHCVRDTQSMVETTAGKVQMRTTWTRVKVQNTSRFTARACRPYLSGIDAEEESGVYSTVFCDTLPLAWSYIKFEPVDIPPGVSFFYDVFYVFKGAAHIHLETQPKPLLFSEILRHGRRYRIRTMVAGESSRPITTVLDVHWKPDFQSKTDTRLVSTG